MDVAKQFTSLIRLVPTDLHMFQVYGSSCRVVWIRYWRLLLGGTVIGEPQSVVHGLSHQPSSADSGVIGLNMVKLDITSYKLL